jgi:hypothetical protein
VTFRHLSQLLSNPAVLPCELAVASGVGPVFVLRPAVVGDPLVCLCRPLVAVCGFVKAGSNGLLGLIVEVKTKRSDAFRRARRADI